MSTNGTECTHQLLCGLSHGPYHAMLDLEVKEKSLLLILFLFKILVFCWSWIFFCIDFIQMATRRSTPVLLRSPCFR